MMRCASERQFGVCAGTFLEVRFDVPFLMTLRVVWVGSPAAARVAAGPRYSTSTSSNCGTASPRRR